MTGTVAFAALTIALGIVLAVLVLNALWVWRKFGRRRCRTCGERRGANLDCPTCWLHHAPREEC